MTKDNAQEYWPLVRALSDHNTIQWHDGKNWVDCVGEIGFEMEPSKYRVKPVQKARRPLTKADVPPGSEFRILGRCERYTPLVVCDKGVVLFTSGPQDFFYKDMMDYLQIQRPGADATWEPCWRD